MTLLDKGHAWAFTSSRLAICMSGRWAGRLMKTVSGDGYCVPSDYGLGEISRLRYCIWREE